MKFYMQNCVGDEAHFESDSIIDAIHKAWNIEADLYIFDEDNNICIIFEPFYDNECNNEMLQEYGLRIIDHKGYRKVQSIDTGEIHEAPWH